MIGQDQSIFSNLLTGGIWRPNIEAQINEGNDDVPKCLDELLLLFIT